MSSLAGNVERSGSTPLRQVQAHLLLQRLPEYLHHSQVAVLCSHQQRTGAVLCAAVLRLHPQQKLHNIAVATLTGDEERPGLPDSGLVQKIADECLQVSQRRSVLQKSTMLGTGLMQQVLQHLQVTILCRNVDRAHATPEAECHIAPMLHKRLDYLQMVILRRHKNRAGPAVHAQILLGYIQGQQELHCREVSILRRNEHWSGAILRLLVDLSAAFEQQFCHIFIVLLRRDVHRSGSPGGFAVHIGS
mmetsp:Transcript_19300/g.45334  ORF Transcript_19300/g.45334 Transcript_19300/m.45334 type:complete len:247 (-) Transcript_19300:237-977(-)